MLLDIYNAYLIQGVFLIRWKWQTLMLVIKGKGDPTQASAYKRLCMLVYAAKLLKKLPKFRLNTEVENVGDSLEL